MTASPRRSMTRNDSPSAFCAEKSDRGPECGEIVAPTAAPNTAADKTLKTARIETVSLPSLEGARVEISAGRDDEVVGLRAMNMLRIPPALPKVRRKAPAARKQRETATRLELTLEMPSQRPKPTPAEAEPQREPERGVAEVDFYI